ANYNGSDSFVYQVNDGAADSNLATVTLTVTPVNDPPVASAESYTTAEDATLSVTGILADASDIDGDPPTTILVSGPSHGSLTLTVTPVNDPPVASAESYTTAEDATLSVTGLLADASDIDGDPLTTILVTGPSHGSLTFSSDGSFTYTPAANYNGSDSFVYK